MTWTLVLLLAAAAYSFKVVGRQGMDRARWDQTLTFMTEKHNMPAPDPETRTLVSDEMMPDQTTVSSR